MKTASRSKQKLQRLTTAAVLSALSIVLMLTVRFSIFPSAPFYEMEFSDLPILICSSVLGPVYSIVSLFVVCLIQTLTVSASSGIIGFLMHFLSSGLMILTMYFLKKSLKGLKGVVVSAVAGVLVVVIVMIPMNMWLTSEFMNLAVKDFIAGFLGVCIAFNGIKSGSNIILFNLLSSKVVKEYSKIVNKGE